MLHLNFNFNQSISFKNVKGIYNQIETSICFCHFYYWSFKFFFFFFLTFIAYPLMFHWTVWQDGK